MSGILLPRHSDINNKHFFSIYLVKFIF